MCIFLRSCLPNYKHLGIKEYVLILRKCPEHKHIGSQLNEWIKYVEITTASGIYSSFHCALLLISNDNWSVIGNKWRQLSKVWPLVYYLTWRSLVNSIVYLNKAISLKRIKFKWGLTLSLTCFMRFNMTHGLLFYVVLGGRQNCYKYLDTSGN